MFAIKSNTAKRSYISFLEKKNVDGKINTTIRTTKNIEEALFVEEYQKIVKLKGEYQLYEYRIVTAHDDLIERINELNKLNELKEKLK